MVHNDGVGSRPSWSTRPLQRRCGRGAVTREANGHGAAVRHGTARE